MSAPVIHYNFDENPSLAGDVEHAPDTPTLAITRATDAWMKDSDGWLRMVQSGEPRFSGAEFNENQWIYSETFAAGTGHNATNITATAGSATTPNGNDATLISNQAAGVGQYHYGWDDFTWLQPIEGKIIFQSYDVKYVAGSGIIWMLAQGNEFVYFDIVNGTIGTESGTDWISYGIWPLRDGWFRIYAAHQATSATRAYGVGMAEVDGTPNWNSTGAADQEQIYVGEPVLKVINGGWNAMNLAPQSEGFNTSPWAINSNGTIAASSETDPFGGNNAEVMTSQNLGGSGQVSSSQAFTFPEAGRYIYSWYAKEGGTDAALMQVTGIGALSMFTYFRLDGTGVGSTNDIVQADMIELDNGWYRCWFEFDIPSPDLVGNISARLAVTPNGGSVNLDGVTSIHFFGAQVEKKKPNQYGPSTYIRTGASGKTIYTPGTYIETTAAPISSLSGSNDGLLVEEARTNLCLESEDITTTWTAGQSTPVADQVIAPDGSLTGDKLIDDAATGTAQIYVGQNITGATSTSYVLSVWGKKDQVDHLLIQVAGQPSSIYRTFDLNDGTLGTTSLGTHVADIEDWGNGWYRCWLQFTTDSVDNTFEYRIAAYDGDTVAAQDRDGTTSIFVWGAMCEAGTRPSSYIQTEGSTATRNIDVITSTDVSWYDDSAGGTLYTDAAASQEPNAVQVIAEITGGNNDRFVNYYNSDDPASFSNLNGGNGSSIIDTGSGTALKDVYLKLAFAIATNDAVFYHSGTQVGTDSVVDIPSNITSIRMGINFANSTALNGHIKRVAYWPVRLSNEVLEDLSAGTLTMQDFVNESMIERRRRIHKRRVMNRMLRGRFRRT